MRLLHAWRMPAAAFLLATILGASTVLAQSTNLPTISSTGNVAIPTATSGTAAASSGTTSDGSAAASGSSGADASSTNNLPGLSSASNKITTSTGAGGSSITGSGGSTGPPSLPTTLTISGAYSYPAPTVPPTANAPYLQKSNLPQDTVFIIVGAIIAFVAIVILAWRVVGAWSVNRSVRNAATGAASYNQMTDMKHQRKKSGLGPYETAPMGSTMSMEKLGPGSRNGTTTAKSHTPNASLFFSPTAGAGMHTAAGNRGSSYLPSGYYSAGNAAPGGGTGTTTIGGGGGDRASKLRPQSNVMVNARPVDPSPPDSPDMRPSTGGGASFADSRSSLSLVPRTNNRTPSTYLDDMMSNSAPAVPRHSQGVSRQSQGPDRDVRRY